MKNIYESNETMKLLGNQIYFKIFGKHQLEALGEVISAHPYCMTADAATDVFMLGYIYGKRAERSRKKTTQKNIVSEKEMEQYQLDQYYYLSKNMLEKYYLGGDPRKKEKLCKIYTIIKNLTHSEAKTPNTKSDNESDAKQINNDGLNNLNKLRILDKSLNENVRNEEITRELLFIERELQRIGGEEIKRLLFAQGDLLAEQEMIVMDVVYNLCKSQRI